MKQNSRYLVIADDFTGANDTGVQICRRGLPVSVVLSSDGVKTDDCSYVIDTESRALSKTETQEKLTRQLQSVDFSSFHHVIKKVDSTLRGNIGVEIAATQAVMNADLVLFAPALPSLGRTTKNAVHMLNQVPITQTEMARDPKTPVREDNIQVILQKAFSQPVRHIGLQEIESGTIDFSGATICTADATSNHHLELLVQAALQTGRRILWCGTAAIADVLLGLERNIPPALAVIASLSQVSNQQLLWAQKQGAALVSVPVNQLILGQVTPEEIAAQSLAFLKEGKDVLLASAASVDRKTGLANADRAAQEKGMALEQVSFYTQDVIGTIARLILEQFRPSGVFLTGGDTAIAFMRSLEASGSMIQTEILVGIPMMRLRGGPWDGLKLITKAGAFGREDAIDYALRKLKEVDFSYE
ncbi:MAG: four-carbon acid sugar kinase family protein [Oscillospiraceae bacterium]|jgi:uncharacterized protein YgbK (DUF1537 family)